MECVLLRQSFRVFLAREISHSDTPSEWCQQTFSEGKRLHNETFVLLMQALHLLQSLKCTKK